MSALKFDWITTVGADGRLTAGERFVLMQIALQWTTVDRPTFHIRQDTIAERLAVSLRLVNGSVASAKRLGYITMAQPRKRGNGESGAHHWRLVDPTELYAGSAHNSESCTHETTELYARNDEVIRTDCKSYTHEIFETGHLTSENDVNKALSSALDNALESAPARACADRLALPEVFFPEEEQIIDAELVDADPDPEPPQYCPSHMPDGIIGDCRFCFRARKRHEEWEKRDQERIAAALFSAPRPAPPLPEKPTYECSTCQDTNIVLDRNGRPGSHPRICHHGFINDGDRAGRWHLATPEELAEHADLLKELNEGITA